MVASLDSVIFHQVYGDNSGGSEFDTDGDGTATQEDEFVSVQNTSGAPVDVSGWQVWSDMSGAGAPDSPQDGLYHTFPDGTVLQPGETLYVINEITGTPKGWAQEASEGGLESGAGGTNTNFLTEGDGNANASEGVALVNPDTGEYIVISFAANNDPDFEGMSGFPGTSQVGLTNAATQSGVEDQNAGSSYQYNSATDSYEVQAVAVPCFASGTLILTEAGERPVECLKIGDRIVTADHGLQSIRWIGKRSLTFDKDHTECHKPIEIKAGALAMNIPRRTLVVSPQHQMLLSGTTVKHLFGVREVIGMAKGLTCRQHIRRMNGKKAVTYHALLFDRHEILFAEGAPNASFRPGAYIMSQLTEHQRKEIYAIYPRLRAQPETGLGPSARLILKRKEVETLAAECFGPLVDHASYIASSFPDANRFMERSRRRSSATNYPEKMTHRLAAVGSLGVNQAENTLPTNDLNGATTLTTRPKISR